MDLSTLGAVVQMYFKRGLASSTTRSYESAKKRYLVFCYNEKLSPLPVSQYSARLFAASLVYDLSLFKSIWQQ